MGDDAHVREADDETGAADADPRVAVAPLTTADRARLASNWARVHERVAAACEAAGREVADVAVLPVTKYSDAAVCRAMIELGATALGESRIQDVQAKSRARGLATFKGWHMIGHLQRNKARKAVQLCAAIYTVDSLRLAEAIDRIAVEEARTEPMPIYLEVKLATDDTKTGCDPADLPALIDACCQLDRLRILGLMTIPSYTDDPEGARPAFARLRQLRDDHLPVGGLSMGMTHDFEIAIAEGATCVRIGSAFVDGLDRAT